MSKEKVNLGGLPVEDTPGAQVYKVPVESITLPSRGMVYPVESSLHMAESVDIRSMTARDEDILTSPALLRKGIATNELLRACVMDKTVAIDDFLVGDRNALLIALRASSYGSEYEAQVMCPSCEEQFSHKFNLRGLPIRPLKVEPIEPGVNLFKFIMPSSGAEVLFKLLTGKEEKLRSEEQKRRKKAIGVGGIDNNVTGMLFHTIMSIAGITDRKEIAMMIGDMPVRDSLELRSYIEEISPSVDWFEDIQCNSCGEEREVEMPVTVDFFWPSTRRKR